MSLKTHLVKHVGSIITMTAAWRTPEPCPKADPWDRGRHAVEVELARSMVPHDDALWAEYSGGKFKPADSPLFQNVPCENCGLIGHAIEYTGGSRRPLYDSEDGKVQPGAIIYEQLDCATDGPCIYGWTNCDGKHINAVLPDGWKWDMMSRASNCTMRDDTLHRCWCVHGEGAELTVDKVGLTCQAGAGSIISPGGWHGFLRQGYFVQC